MRAAVQSKDALFSGRALLTLIQAVLSKGKLFRFRAPGNSMHPFVRNGDTLTLAPIRRRPRVGDIVAFIHPFRANVVVHRVIEVRKTACLIRGDAASPGCDGWVPFDRILGRVVRIHRETKAIFFGLGPERRLIAFLSARGWLLPVQSNVALRAIGKLILR